MKKKFHVLYEPILKLFGLTEGFAAHKAATEVP